MEHFLELRAKQDDIRREGLAIFDKALAEERDTTAAEDKKLDKLMKERIRLHTEEGRYIVEHNLQAEIDRMANRSPILPQPGEGESRTVGLGNGKIGVRSYRQLFEAPLSDDGFTSFSEWTSIVTSRQYDPRMRRSISEGIPSEGGFLVPTQYADAILTPSLEQSVIFPRARVFPMKSNELVIPATVIGDHSASCYGGVIAYWKAEKGSLSQADPTFRQMNLVANKLTILSKATNEWLQDVERSGDLVRGILTEAVHWFLDKNFMIGTGAGQPLGLLNAACKVTVAAEAGQPASTILYENIVKMFSSLYPGGIDRAIWLIHPSVVPQLFTMSLSVGTGGIPVYMPADQGAGRPHNKLMGLPVVVSEKVETLGTEGDIILADLSQYGIGLRGELQLEASGAPAFTTDETYFRLIIRIDGQPLWDEVLTLKDGTTTVSPIVTLEARP